MTAAGEMMRELAPTPPPRSGASPSRAARAESGTAFEDHLDAAEPPEDIEAPRAEKSDDAKSAREDDKPAAASSEQPDANVAEAPPAPPTQAPAPTPQPALQVLAQMTDAAPAHPAAPQNVDAPIEAPLQAAAPSTPVPEAAPAVAPNTQQAQPSTQSETPAQAPAQTAANQAPATPAPDINPLAAPQAQAAENAPKPVAEPAQASAAAQTPVIAAQAAAQPKQNATPVSQDAAAPAPEATAEFEHRDPSIEAKPLTTQNTKSEAPPAESPKPNTPPQLLAQLLQNAQKPNLTPASQPNIGSETEVDALGATTQLAAAPPQAGAASHAALEQSAARAAPAAAQVGREIIRRFQGENTRFELRLDPPELGRVEVRLEVSRDHKVTAVIAADSPQALTELARHARDLEQALQSAGLDLSENGLSFDLSQKREGGGETDEASRLPGAGNMEAEAETPQTSRPIGFERWRGVRVDLVA